MIKLYQTKKLSGHLSNLFCQTLPDISTVEMDPLFSWYGDMFSLNRKVNLIFTNELTKFSFLLLGYRKSEHPDFAAAFRYYLACTLKLHNIYSVPYLVQTAAFGKNTKSNKSPLAHISRFKIDFVPSLKTWDALLEKQEPGQQYAYDFNTCLTSYPWSKGYATPAQVMREALENRQLL